jgi:membrane protein DedA with SNARE-associated domain
VFLAIAALPWTLALSWVVDRVGELPVWLNLSLMSAGILVNALILYGAGRMLRSVLAR